VILQPNGAPAKKRRVPMNRVDVKTVVEFERWANAMGLAMDLYCRKCSDTLGPSKSRCWANNNRYDEVYHLECHCTDRVYGREPNTIPERPGRAVVEPKIQVLVP